MTTCSQADVYAEAQRMLDEHVVSIVTGRCATCGVPGPCCRRLTAAAVFFAMGWLPHRIPGQTRPEMVGARRIPIPASVGGDR